MNAGEHTGGDHRGRETRALLVGPVHDLDRVLGLDAEIIQRPDHLQRAENAENTVILAAGRLGIQMAAQHHRKRIGVRAFAPGKHVAHAVDPHGQALVFTPLGEQITALLVGIGQRLAVITAAQAGPDLRHVHKAVPQPLPVDPDIAGRFSHPKLSCSLRPLAGTLLIGIGKFTCEGQELGDCRLLRAFVLTPFWGISKDKVDHLIKIKV